MNGLPQECAIDAARPVQLAAEYRLANWLCRFAPLIGVAAWYLAARYLLFLLYLYPGKQEFVWLAAVRWRPAVLVGFGAGGLAFLWRWAVVAERARLSRSPQRSRFVSSSFLLGCAFVSVAGAAMESRHARWFFLEWAKIRTPLASFARNTLLWEGRDFEVNEPSVPTVANIGLIGSSQIYQGTDGKLLAQLIGCRVEKNCLAGFGPMQYLWLERRIRERQHDVCVFWLSEFDFFREEDLPVNRLRWTATSRSVVELTAILMRHRPFLAASDLIRAIRNGKPLPLNRDDVLRSRGDIADLLFAAFCPLWRNRDHVRRSLFGYWWNISEPDSDEGKRDGPQLASAVSEMSLARKTLGQNVGRKRLVDVNFLAFERFARNLTKSGKVVIVLEGSSHPDLATAYDPQLRGETRSRLRQMSAPSGFAYFDETRVPIWNESDFGDPYHLGAQGREKFTRYLADLVTSGLASRTQRKPGDAGAWHK